MKNQKGFIQIPLLIAIIAGVLVLGGGGYFGVKQYQNYQAEKVEERRLAQETDKIRQGKEDQGSVSGLNLKAFEKKTTQTTTNKEAPIIPQQKLPPTDYKN